MINFDTVDKTTFLNEYWQKKPLVFRKAIPCFNNPITPDDLAGLALEDEFQSRIVRETPEEHPRWHVQYGPFTAKDFKSLPKTHWTLLVQGVDKLIPSVSQLLQHFIFIPTWRIDDIMISYAVEQGSVGPHYDNYDVFLYQAQGTRRWQLTTQGCHPENYLQDTDLRIMQQFDTEQEFILEPGDMLYLPPHVAHHGVSLSEHCMTYSFGYRSYQGLELWNSLSEFLEENGETLPYYRDPNWNQCNNTAAIPAQAIAHAKQLLLETLEDEQRLRQWFGSFVTRLDYPTEQLLPIPRSTPEMLSLEKFVRKLRGEIKALLREATCRFAYYDNNLNQPDSCQLYINGQLWNTHGVTPDLIHKIANQCVLAQTDFISFLDHQANQEFLHALWQQGWLEEI